MCVCVRGGAQPVRIYFKYMSRELNKREGIKYFLTFLRVQGLRVPFHESSCHQLHPRQSPMAHSVFSTSSVDAFKILAFVSPWFFADLGVLLFFCVIMGISGRN